MQSQLILEKNGMYTLTVSLDTAEFSVYVDKASRRMRNELSVDGFRRGRVPPREAERHISEPQIREEALAIAVRDSLSRVFEEKDLDVAHVGDLNITRNTPEGLEYRVTMLLFPDVSVSVLPEFAVERKKIAVAKPDVRKALEALQKSRASFVPKEGAIREGDRAEVSFEICSHGKVIDGGVSKNHPIIVGDKRFIPGFEEGLIGMAKGESKSFTITPPADHTNVTIAGKPLDVSVEVTDVRAVEKPVLDDAFAQSVGAFTTLHELEKSVHKGLMQEKEEEERRRIRTEIVRQLAEAVQLSVPQPFLDHELDVMVAQFDRSLHAQGMELGPYLSQFGKTVDDLRKDWRSDAERQARSGILVHKIARDRGIGVTDDELDSMTAELVQQASVRDGVDARKVDVSSMKERVRDQLVREKTLAYLERKYQKET